MLPSLLRESKPSVIPASSYEHQAHPTINKPSSSANSDGTLPLTLSLQLNCSQYHDCGDMDRMKRALSLSVRSSLKDSTHMTQHMYWRASIIIFTMFICPSTLGNYLLRCRACIERALFLCPSWCHLLAQLMMPCMHAGFPI